MEKNSQFLLIVLNRILGQWTLQDSPEIITAGVQSKYSLNLSMSPFQLMLILSGNRHQDAVERGK